MSKKSDDKGLLNELLPDPNRALKDLAEGTPRGRTAEHLKRVLAAGLALSLSTEVAGCGSPGRSAQKPDEPRGYGVVDPVPPPPPFVIPGFLSLKSTPVANITIDGQPTGLKTPQMNISLAAGIHTIRLDVPAKKLEQNFSVEIISGNTRSEVRDLRSARRVPKK
jgi:hypothetical protein